MELDKSQVIARERLWEKRAGIAALVGSVLAVVGFVLFQRALGGDTNFEGLQEAHDKSSTIWLSGAATAIGVPLLIGPLLFLFKAAQARSPLVRNQFLGLVFLGPLLLAVAALAIAAGTQQAANNYLDGKAESTLSPKEAAEDCKEDREDQGAKDFADEFKPKDGSGPLATCVVQKQEEDKASNAITDVSLVGIGQFTGLAGGMALIVALFYTGLWAMRTGLLTRFWGSFGMAVGITVLIGLSPIAMFWFFYIGLFLLGFAPGGRPPAWAAGEAIPWPTPGEKAAADLSPSEDSSQADEDHGSSAADPEEAPEKGQSQ